MMLELQTIKTLDRYELNISLSHDRGILVIQGASGSGKTTLLDCIAGLRQPDNGFIRLNGIELFNQQTRLVLTPQQRKVGYVFQSYALFPHLTVLQNLLYGVDSSWLSVISPFTSQRGLRLLGESPLLTRWVEAFNLKHLLNKYPSQISGGERQRVALARALATAPDLLLLDEPFSALDTVTRSQVHEEFLDFSKAFAIPILLVTHNAEEAQLLGDRIIHMAEGQIIENKKT